MLTRLLRRAKPLVHEPLAGGRDAFRSRRRSARRVLQPLQRVRQSRTGEDATDQPRELDRRRLALTPRTVRQRAA